MKKQLFLFAALCGSSAVASAIELTDFTDPNTAYDDAYLTFKANAQSGNQDQVSYDASLGGFYNKRDSTDKRVLTLNINGDLRASRNGSKLIPDEDDFGFNVSGSRDAYFSETNDKLFYFTSGQFGYRDSAVDENLGVSAGLGYGRVWNSTPLARALRVQEEMLEKGILSAKMSDEALLEFSAIVAKEDEYRSIHGVDEYRGVWYADMEQVIVASGVLVGESLSALATVDLDQVLRAEQISARRHGWLVRGGAGIQFSTFTGEADGDPKLTFQAEYAKPYGLRGQLINLTSYDPVFGDNTIQKLSNLLTYTYEVSDRIDWLNSWDLRLEQTDGSPKSRSTINVLTTGFNYKLSNELSLLTELKLTDTDSKPARADDREDADINADISLVYRLK